MCYLLLEYSNPGLTAMQLDTHTFGKQSFMRENKVAYSTNRRVIYILRYKLNTIQYSWLLNYALEKIIIIIIIIRRTYLRTA